MPTLRRLKSLLALLAVLGLVACGCSTAKGDEELRALRERLERLEQDAAQDRARETEDLRAMREDLDTLRANLDALGRQGGEGAQNATAQQHKSPRAALRESFHNAVESSKQALERLNRSLEKSLSRPKAQENAPPAQQ
jgi:hypothetical protein